MIRVEIERKLFGGTEVLRDIRFAVAPGEVVALLGPSGVGKSTLLRIVAGIDTDFEGRVERPRRLGMAFQEPILLPWRSAAENLTLTHPGLGTDGAEEALARVGMAGMGGHFPGQLSLGQQRRVALARAIAGAPEALILDEPFASLDAETGAGMVALTARLIAETRAPTLFVTHSAEEARTLGTRVLRLGGRPATITAEDGQG